MCTLAIYFRCSNGFPLVVAANRDEFYARPTAEPRVIAADPWVAAGQDLNAGGTWLGVNEHCMVAGLLNRRTPQGPDPSRRSRGLLCLEVLQSGRIVDARARLREEDPAAYNPFNLLVATSEEAFVATNDGIALAVTPLTPGVHVLTNLNLNDPTCPRIAGSHQLFEAVSLSAADGDLAHLLAALRRVLSDHRVSLDPRLPSRHDTLCIHSPGYGTRSSSIILYAGHERRMRYWHAYGPPCISDYQEVPLPS